MNPLRPISRAGALLLTAAALLTAPAAAAAAVAASPQEAPGGELLVLGAASLTDVLPRVAELWTGRTGVSVRFSFDATSRLAPQVLQGAPGDVFFSADQRWMDWLAEHGGVRPGTVRELVANELVVVVPGGRAPPAGPADLRDLERLALAGENAPAGRYAEQALIGAGVWEAVRERVVRAGSVRGALEWAARGEVDAAVVYRTDAIAEPGVTVAFAFPAESHSPIRYPAAVLANAAEPQLAEAFLAFAAGPEAAEVFRSAGFVPDPAGGPEPRAQADAAAADSIPATASAIRISLVVALLATLAGLPLALGIGWLLARRTFPGKILVTTVVFAPLVVPPVVTGFLLLSVLGTQAPLGRWLAAAGVPVPFTLLGAAVAALVVGLPLYVLTVRNAFESVDPHYEEVSWTLGVPPRRTFLRISLPLALPGIAAGAVLAFARALGEFGATVVLAGNLEGETRTIALAVYTLLESPTGRDTTWVLVGASVALALAALLGYEALSRRQRRRMEVDRGP